MLSDNPIRPTVRAVIRRGPLVLVQVKQAASGRRYLTLPGGRQEVGETMQQCLQRECQEEIGIAPRLVALLHVADVMRTAPDRKRHLTESLFFCEVPPDYEPQMGLQPDSRQVATVWADPARDGPLFLPRYDLALTRADAPVYLGCLRCETP